MKKINLKKIVTALAFIGIVTSLYAGGKKDKTDHSYLDDETKDADPCRVLYNHDEPEGDPIVLNEVWGYVMYGREDKFTNDMPITDLCYFSADVNSYGEITDVPKASYFRNRGYEGRIHLVVTCTGRALTHLVMEPDFGVRKTLVSSIAKMSKDYDGVQIDFETVPARDVENFRTFLTDVRKAIGKDKIFSVALAARVKKISDDIYNYEKIYPLADKIIIMAYDEHWSGSVPGSVASYDWCEKVSDYSKSVIPEEKLVMGLPFYGRTWQEGGSYGSAWVFTSISRILNENNITHVERENGVPYFSATIPVNVTGYFEDTYSLVTRARMYNEKGIDKFAFWRVGQEDISFWQWLKIYGEDDFLEETTSDSDPQSLED